MKVKISVPSRVFTITLREGQELEELWYIYWDGIYQGAGLVNEMPQSNEEHNRQIQERVSRQLRLATSIITDVESNPPIEDVANWIKSPPKAVLALLMTRIPEIVSNQVRIETLTEEEKKI